MNDLLNENSTTISVVIPTYFRSTELSDLLCSILNQTTKPMEIIIVDDTPNNSIKITVEKFKKSFDELGVALFYVKNPKDRSISIARNLGASTAKGDIVCFVDADVTIAQDYLQELQNTFEKHPEALGVAGIHADLVGLRLNWFNKISKLFCLFNLSQNSSRIFELPINLNEEILCEWFEGNAMAFKKRVFNEFQFDEKLVKYSYMEDVLFTGQIHKANPKGLMITPKAKYVHTPSNVGRMEKAKEKERKRHYLSYRKYVLTKLFGSKGIIIFGWQNLGALFVKTVYKILGKETYTEIYGI